MIAGVLTMVIFVMKTRPAFIYFFDTYNILYIGDEEKSERWQMRSKKKHLPSGVLISWLGKDDKVHIKSIGFNCCSSPLREQVAATNAKSELLCLQLDYLGGNIKSVPVVTFGLTRATVRQQVNALYASKELQLPI